MGTRSLPAMKLPPPAAPSTLPQLPAAPPFTSRQRLAALSMLHRPPPALPNTLRRPPPALPSTLRRPPPALPSTSHQPRARRLSTLLPPPAQPLRTSHQRPPVSPRPRAPMSRLRPVLRLRLQLTPPPAQHTPATSLTTRRVLALAVGPALLLTTSSPLLMELWTTAPTRTTTRCAARPSPFLTRALLTKPRLSTLALVARMLPSTCRHRSLRRLHQTATAVSTALSGGSTAPKLHAWSNPIALQNWHRALRNQIC